MHTHIQRTKHNFPFAKNQFTHLWVQLAHRHAPHGLDNAQQELSLCFSVGREKMIVVHRLGVSSNADTVDCLTVAGAVFGEEKIKDLRLR